MIFKRGKKGIYWYRFQWNGKLIRESTKQTNDKVARQMESAHRTSLAKGEVGIREKKPALTLREFLKEKFLPDAETNHAAKPRTLRYYKQGANMLLKSDLAGLRLDELTDEHAQDFKTEYSGLSASGINRGLRTLRRALNLAHKWRKLEHPVKITLASGERQRDRVLTEEETDAYLNASPQPWKDCATIIVEQGFRPGEVFVLKWEHVFFSKDGTGMIQIVDGKSKAARRILPMTPKVYALLKARHKASGSPEEGWIFPTASREGNFNQHTAKDQHAKALKDAGFETEEKAHSNNRPFSFFVPYVLRHTALTRIGESCNDPFTLMRIAGHSTITMTQRYIHPQDEAIEKVFANLAAKNSKSGTKKPPQSSGVGTKKGTNSKSTKSQVVKL